VTSDSTPAHSGCALVPHHANNVFKNYILYCPFYCPTIWCMSAQLKQPSIRSSVSLLPTLAPVLSCYLAHVCPALATTNQAIWLTSALSGSCLGLLSGACLPSSSHHQSRQLVHFCPTLALSCPATWCMSAQLATINRAIRVCPFWLLLITPRVGA
jgi:hypothetical protein